MCIRDRFLTNGVGAVNRSYRPGDLMLMRDHLSLFIPSPLLGENMDELGPRFPDMTHVYREDLCEAIRSAAAQLRLRDVYKRQDQPGGKRVFDPVFYQAQHPAAGPPCGADQLTVLCAKAPASVLGRGGGKVLETDFRRKEP